jgi:hypothetical protein
MLTRGIATSRDYRFLKWSPDKVKEVMQPSNEVVSKVRGNSRVPYTEAGGLRIGKSRNDPNWKWVDTYSAIKVENINAVFGCYIDRPGSEPTFRLHLTGVEIKTCNPDGLSEALAEWRKVAQSCGLDEGV